jgi:exodeoxyribonuclease VII small subunit
MEAKTFREAYDVLQQHAQTLRDQDEPNIDDLLDIVNESVAAYKVCKQRIDAVEKALEEALSSAGLEGAGRPPRSGASLQPVDEPQVTSKTRPPSQRAGFEDVDDDIPF